MQYMALIYRDETAPMDMPAVMQAYGAFHQELIAAGHEIVGEPLEGTETATSVRVRGGETQITDGPFAETKEQLGGFYLFDCASLDEAVALAAKIPTAQHGTIEVRPVMQLELPA